MWLNEPESIRAIENKQLTKEIKEAFVESGGVYGSPRITAQLRRDGTRVGDNRVARLMPESDTLSKSGLGSRLEMSPTLWGHFIPSGILLP